MLVRDMLVRLHVLAILKLHMRLAQCCVKLYYSTVLGVPSRGGSRGRVQGVRTPLPLPEMTCGFLIQLVFCKKKNYVVYWC